MRNIILINGALFASLVLVACGADSGNAADPAVTDSPAVSATTTDETATTTIVEEIDEEAVAVLKRMTDTVAALQEFKVTMETGFDVTQPDGEKLEFGSRRSASIRRPDQARFKFQKRSGQSGQLVFDGTDIWAYDPEENVYASIPQPGDIDASLDFATVELGFTVPVSDFFSDDPGAHLAEGVITASDLGPSTVAGRPGRQVAFRKPGVDYQVWVGDADSLPTRVVITYTEEPGQPQFWAQFIEWDTAPGGDDAVFSFELPEGAESIRFATFDGSVEVDEGAAQ